MSRILVVEDEAHLAEGLRFNLEAEGHSVVVTGKGEEALKLLLKEKEDFEALVLDVMLPGKDGFTVARELREAQNYIPLLMLTARSRSEDVLKGFRVRCRRLPAEALQSGHPARPPREPSAPQELDAKP